MCVFFCSFLFYFKFSSFFASLLNSRSRQINSIHLVNCNKIGFDQMSNIFVVPSVRLMVFRGRHQQITALSSFTLPPSITWTSMFAQSVCNIDFNWFPKNFYTCLIISSSILDFELFSSNYSSNFSIKKWINHNNSLWKVRIFESTIWMNSANLSSNRPKIVLKYRNAPIAAASFIIIEMATHRFNRIETPFAEGAVKLI